jgi:prevent-host-death family protein
MLVNVHEAKTHLSALLERVAAGEEIVIGKSGRPIAKLVPYDGAVGPRVPGGWQGRVRIAPDFEELPEEVAASFRGDCA